MCTLTFSVVTANQTIMPVFFLLSCFYISSVYLPKGYFCTPYTYSEEKESRTAIHDTSISMKWKKWCFDLYNLTKGNNSKAVISSIFIKALDKYFVYFETLQMLQDKSGHPSSRKIIARMIRVWSTCLRF